MGLPPAKSAIADLAGAAAPVIDQGVLVAETPDTSLHWVAGSRPTWFVTFSNTSSTGGFAGRFLKAQGYPTLHFVAKAMHGWQPWSIDRVVARARAA